MTLFLFQGIKANGYLWSWLLRLDQNNHNYNFSNTVCKNSAIATLTKLDKFAQILTQVWQFLILLHSKFGKFKRSF